MIDTMARSGGTPEAKQIDQAEPTENTVNKSGKPRRRRSALTAELYTVLEALLPFARIEIERLASYVNDFPHDPDHAEDAVRVQLRKEALESTRRLIARKSAAIRRKQKSLTMYANERVEEAERQSCLASRQTEDIDALAFIDSAADTDEES